MEGFAGLLDALVDINEKLQIPLHEINYKINWDVESIFQFIFEDFFLALKRYNQIESPNPFFKIYDQFYVESEKLFLVKAKIGEYHRIKYYSYDMKTIEEIEKNIFYIGKHKYISANYINKDDEISVKSGFFKDSYHEYYYEIPKEKIYIEKSLSKEFLNLLELIGINDESFYFTIEKNKNIFDISREIIKQIQEIKNESDLKDFYNNKMAIFDLIYEIPPLLKSFIESEFSTKKSVLNP